MAGELDIQRISAPVLTEPNRELIQQQQNKSTLTPKVNDEEFEVADVSAERRAALEDAIASQNVVTKGKLVIEHDEETGRFIQKTIDPETGEVLEQWPDEKFLELVKSMGEAYGLLVDRNV